ncbi:MAG: hypothetical protein KKA79_05075 [Nanoarchaeota archaeon]|nr:hypothetical protein [Nanoarchaeota archaeon]
MAFDKSLDKELFSETIDFERTRINVGVYSYNEGDKKLQLGRENANAAGEWNFAKLGRMTKAEAERAIPVIQKALEHM